MCLVWGKREDLKGHYRTNTPKHTTNRHSSSFPSFQTIFLHTNKHTRRLFTLLHHHLDHPILPSSSSCACSLRHRPTPTRPVCVCSLVAAITDPPHVMSLVTFSHVSQHHATERSPEATRINSLCPQLYLSLGTTSPPHAHTYAHTATVTLHCTLFTRPWRRVYV